MLVADFMPVLQRRRTHTIPIRQWVMEGRLPKGLYSTLDALRGAQERDLITVDDSLPGRAGRSLLLTGKGLSWKPGEDGQPEPLEYTWSYHGRGVTGSLADWGRSWAVKAHQVPGGPLGWTLAARRYSCYMPHVHEVDGRWRIVAAGEQAFVDKADGDGGELCEAS
jgi:hypothetical protein